MSSLLKSVVLQTRAERALEREKSEVRVSALQDLRFELCRIVDELIAHEEQVLDQDPNDFEEL